MYGGLLLVLLASTVNSASGRCYNDNMYEPMDERDGDYIIVGFFNIGSIRKGICFNKILYRHQT